MFFIITGAIWLGGAGAVIVGGLFWKRGTNTGAFAALIIGCVGSLISIVLQQNWVGHVYPWLTDSAPQLLSGLKHNIEAVSTAVPGINWVVGPDKFPIDSRWMSLFTVIFAASAYVICALFEWLILKKPAFNLPKMLHRGKYAVKGDHEEKTAQPPTGWRALQYCF